MVDLMLVSESLKDKARCDGQGPVFAESDILRAVERGVVGCGDGLL